jgi:hypothetical protein
MTHFEFISVALSIVLSFAVLRLLDALPHAMARERRYGVHLLWIFFLLWWSAVFWWFSWSHRSHQGEFAFPAFLVLVMPPAILYLCATALVSHAPAEITSWRYHFWKHRRRFFGLALALLLSLVFTSTALQHIPLRHPLRGSQALLFLVFGAGWVSKSERTHTILAVLAAAFAATMVVLSAAGVVDFRLPGTVE